MDNKKEDYTKKQRVMAAAGLAVMAALIAGLIAAAIAKAPAGVLLALLFCIMIIPCIIYGASIYVKRTVIKKEKKDD